jgi:Glycosyltransferase family 87
VHLRLRPFPLHLVVILLLAAAGYAVVRFKRPELVDFAVPRLAAARFVAHEPLYQADDGHYQYKYLPAFAAFMVPFIWLPKQVAEAVWFTLMVAMTWALVRLAVHALPERRTPMSSLMWITLLLNGKFLVKELLFGQFNLPLALLLLRAVIAGQHGRGLAAGGLIAAGVFIKPYALVLLPWLVWTQGLRPLMPFFIVLAAGLVLPVVSYGWEGNLTLLQDWYRTVTDTTAPNLLAPENVSFASMWAKWLHPGPLPSLLALASSVAAVGAGLAVIWRRKPVAQPNYLEGAYFFVLIPLLSPQGWDYVMLLALPAYVCLVDRWRDTSLGWRVVTMTGFILTSFAVFDLMRRTLYVLLMEWGASTVGAVLIAASLARLRWRAQA